LTYHAATRLAWNLLPQRPVPACRRSGCDRGEVRGRVRGPQRQGDRPRGGPDIRPEPPFPSAPTSSWSTASASASACDAALLQRVL